jgi:hypothetical protein
MSSMDEFTATAIHICGTFVIALSEIVFAEQILLHCLGALQCFF